MPRYVIPVGSLKEARIAMAGREDALKKAIREAQIESALALQRHVSLASSAARLVDTGRYKASWRVHQSALSKRVEVRNDAPHAGIIERGARPFWAPIQPLIEWAERKAADLGIVKLAKGRRFRGRASLTGAQRSAARSLAFAVRAAIAKRGLRPRWIMRSQLPMAARVKQRALEERLARIARP